MDLEGSNFERSKAFMQNLASVTLWRVNWRA